MVVFIDWTPRELKRSTGKVMRRTARNNGEGGNPCLPWRICAYGFILALSLVFRPAVGLAQDSLKAAAIVNDEIVSILDVVMRIRLAIVGAGVEDTPELRDKIGPQILQKLIDERLQLQEAARLEIEIQDEEVEQAIGRVAQQNNLTLDEFMQVLKRQRIWPEVLENQIRAELAWRLVVQRSLSSSVTVSSKDIDAVVARIMSDENRTQYRTGEIFLSVPTASQEAQVRQNAERLLAQVRGGANFSGLARQFSQSESASLGGDLGWIEAAKLPAPLAGALKVLTPGQISNPLRTADGFTILLLRDVRERSEEEIDRTAIEQQLRGQRVNQRAQRSLQELRRAANIDIRI